MAQPPLTNITFFVKILMITEDLLKMGLSFIWLVFTDSLDRNYSERERLLFHKLNQVSRGQCL